MRKSWLSVGLGVLLAGALAPAAWADDKKDADKKDDRDEPRVYAIQIFQGPYRSVQYVTRGDVSPSEMAAARDASRAENEAAYVDRIQDLKRRYVADELAFSARRHEVQMQLYGSDSQTTSSSSLAWNYGGGYGGYGYGGYGYGWGYGGGYPAVSQSLINSTTTNRTLATGPGPETSLQSALTPVIVAQATPEYAARAGRDRTYALRDLPSGRKEKPDVALVGLTTVTLKDGKELKGTLVDQSDPDWVVLKVGTATVRVRSSEVKMTATEEPKGVRPAGNDDK